MDRYRVTEEQCASVVVKNLENALRNPYAHVKKRVDVEDIMNSELHGNIDDIKGGIQYEKSGGDCWCGADSI